ncbi:uncharacterized protein LOC123885326 [Trifolium pratense]|uniref:uncharacterized protein LOC123885326 n=1 Tax=Trifolium pratense TaxID=57577 RepID=UPI001E693E0E|nr:uncharacterized protein LOC123885326 [Trifolium pratense]XP_045790559.1 uncharacterized protein LOC123885326 [Trifolium pratense]
MDRTWMYNRVNDNRFGLKTEFVRGVKQFVKRTINRPIYLSEGGIRCPCVKCKCIKLNTPPMVRYHLYKHGFQPNYLIWTDHGEERPNIHKGGGSNSSGLVHNCQRKRKLQTKIGETSEDSAHEVDEAMRLQLSQKSIGSCSRGQVYDTADVSATLQHGSTSLTKQSQTPSTPPVSGWSPEEDRWTSRVEKTTHNTLVVTREAKEMAHYALVVAREANEGIQKVQNDFDCFKSEFIEHLEALERRQSDGASCSSGHSCSHPRYDDGDDLDDQSLDGNA